MSYSVNQANADLLAVTHGLTINSIPNINGLHNRVARRLLNDIDPIETVRKVLTATPLFSQVWDYACPADLKGNRIIDISPQYIRSPGAVITQTFNQPFDTNKNLFFPPSEFTIQWNNQVKTIRINDTTLPQGVVVDTMDSTGTWVAGTNVSNIVEDNVNFASGSGSLQFTLGTGTASVISETLASQLDLTTQLNQASLFVYLYLPALNVTSVQLKWGNDSSNYYTRTVTTTNEGNAFAVGWNLLRWDWLGCTVVGSPDITKIDYFEFDFVSNGTSTIVRLDNLVSVMGLYRTLEYYSKYMYRDSTTGAFQETVTDNSNLINLDTDSYNLYFNLLAFYAAQQLQGLDAMFYDANFFIGEYEKDKAKYTSRQPSQVQKSRQSYYTPTQGGYGQYIGKRFTF